MSQLALQLIQQEKAAKTGYLELGHCGLNPDNPQLQGVWDALSELTYLKTLILSNEWYNWETDTWEDSKNKDEENLLDKIPDVIVDLVYLKELVIAGQDGENWGIQKIENLPRTLRYLDVSYNQITKLENLPLSISRLDIHFNQIATLENLPLNLSWIDTSYNQIKEIDPLVPFIEKGLDYEITGNPIEHNPTFARHLIAKEKVEKTGYLDLRRCGLYPNYPQLQAIWDALGELTHLETLVLGSLWWTSDGKIKRIRNKGKKNRLDSIPVAIARLVNLKTFLIAGWYSDNRMTINKLENLPQSINALDISANQITKLENLPKNITMLRIGYNQISKLENLPQSIAEIHIYKNEIKKLENLPQSITTLQISSNQISKIENLPQSITTLQIGSNQISKLENLPQSITTLYIGANQISKIENLPQNLSRLEIGGNQINKIENLPQSIAKLNIGYNQIDKIENLPSSLTRLDIGHNQIKDLKPLLPFIQNGLNYRVHRNPLENPPKDVLIKGKVATLRYFEENETQDNG